MNPLQSNPYNPQYQQATQTPPQSNNHQIKIGYISTQRLDHLLFHYYQNEIPNRGGGGTSYSLNCTEY